MAQRVDPVNEAAWRNEMLVAIRENDGPRFAEIVSELERHLDGFEDGYEPEPEMQALIDQGVRELARQ